jgi:signal transduction histidine kinase
VLVLARLVGLGAVLVEVALNSRHSASLPLLVVLAALASAAALIWMFGRPRRADVQVLALRVMALAGGLLAALQHGSAALAFPALAVLQAVTDGSLLDAVTVVAVAVVAVEVGVVWANLDASAAFGYPAILLGSALLGFTRRQYVAQGRAAEELVAQTRRTELASRRAAALDERTRIARDIHDVLAHSLGGLAVQLEAAELLLTERADIDGVLERIRVSRRAVREGLEEARRAVAALRVDTTPLPESLNGLLAAHREQGDNGELVVEGATRPLSPEASLALTRTVQEALTNARRHAPGSAVSVRLVYDSASASVIVSNGAALREPSQASAGATGGYGLAGMRERLELAGGHLVAGPEREGWTVSAEVPS